MCKQHVPIMVYDCGGTQEYCEKCGKAIGEWKQNDPKKHIKKEKNNGDTKGTVRSNQTSG